MNYKLTQLFRRRTGLHEAVDSWINEERNHKKVVKATRTLREYCARKVKQYADNRPVDEIDSDWLQASLDQMAEDGLSGTTVNKSRELLRMVWRDLKKAGAVSSDLEIHGIRSTTKEKKLPDGDDVVRIAEYCKGKKSEAYRIIEFMLYSGARIGEALQMRWEDIGSDFMQVTNIKDHGERKSKRSVPVTTSMADLLDRMGRKKDGPLFTLSDTRRAFARINDVMGYTGDQKLSNHYCRHLFITKCAESGIDKEVVARWVGHRSTQMIDKIYFHLREQHSLAEAKKLNL